MTDTSFTTEDEQQWKLLNDLLSSDVITWNLSTPELIRSYRSLVWFAGLRPKIEANVMEVVKVTKANPPSEESETES